MPPPPLKVTGDTMKSIQQKTCSIEGCNRIDFIERSWCSMHYQRWKKYGDPNAPVRKWVKHGFSRTPEYECWGAMKERCYNIKNKQYNDYGGRGITVCKRWLDFQNFYSDLGKRPSNKHSIERINNDGNYEPSNVTWATRKEQQRNQRKLQKNTPHGHKGVYFINGRWIARIRPNYKTVHLGTFDTKQQAIMARQKAEIFYFSN